MVCGKAEDAGGLSPVKDDNAAARHFIRRTLTIFNRYDYKVHRDWYVSERWCTVTILMF